MRLSLEAMSEPHPITRQASARLWVSTAGPGFTDLTAALQQWLSELQAEEGSVTLFCRHTSASLTVQENADPRVQADLEDALDRLAPADAGWRHDDEGPDDMPAHVKSSLTDASITIPVSGGTPLLGTWQAVYLIEHRASPHRREIRLHFLGR